MTSSRSHAASRDSQQWLDEYRAALSPNSQARDHAFRGLTLRLARGELPSVPVQDPPQLPTPARFAGLGSPAALKLMAVGGVCAVLGGAWLWHQQLQPAAHSGAAPTLRNVSAPAPTAEIAPPESEAAKAPSVSVMPQAPVTVPEVAPGTPQRRTRREHGRNGRALPAGDRHAQPPAAPEAGQQAAAADGAESKVVDAHESGIEAELLLMRSAYQALRAGQPAQALERLGEHAARFPHGELAESRQVARIMALCQAGRVAAARAEAEQFLQVSPNSPFAGRVRSLCVEQRVRPSH
jgi:hypothetical protein